MRPSVIVLAVMLLVLAPSSPRAEDWIQIAPASSPEPLPEALPGAPQRGALLFDTSLGALTLFGQLSGSAEIPMWRWDGNHWQPLAVVANPTSAAGGAVASAHDSARGVTVVYASQKTWEVSGGTWSEVADTAESPGLRDNAAMAFDASRGVTVLFGGTTGFNAFLNDTWEWDGIAWSNVATPMSPTARGSAAMGYDPERERVVLTAGIGLVDGARYLTDTWAYDGTTWVEVATDTAPPQMGDPSMAWDPIRRRLFLWGEQTSSPASTWELDGTSWIPTPLDGLPSSALPGVAAYDPEGERMVLFGLEDTGSGQTWVRASTPQPTPDAGVPADSGPDPIDEGPDEDKDDEDAAPDAGCGCRSGSARSAALGPWLVAASLFAFGRRRIARERFCDHSANSVDSAEMRAPRAAYVVLARLMARRAARVSSPPTDRRTPASPGTRRPHPRW